jgi:hypothetical protein
MLLGFDLRYTVFKKEKTEKKEKIHVYYNHILEFCQVVKIKIKK